MITKSLIVLSLLLNSVGLSGPSARIDDAIIRNELNPDKIAIASENIDLTLPQISPRPKVNSSIRPQINARSYLLADVESGTILLKEAAKERAPIASTTKIMTAMIVLENYQLDDIITISSVASGQVGADAHLRVGEQITVLNLLKALLIKSANGAAYAFAESMNSENETGIDKFVAKMNQRAKELGMEDTEYHDPAGLDVTGYSTAYDLMIITKYALKNEVFTEIVSTPKDVAKDVSGTIWHELDNSNRLVNEYNYPGAIGVKTGYMPEAGHCLVGAVRRDGHTFISVVLYTFSDTASASAEESRKLLDWGFNNTHWE